MSDEKQVLIGAMMADPETGLVPAPTPMGVRLGEQSPTHAGVRAFGRKGERRRRLLQGRSRDDRRLQPDARIRHHGGVRRPVGDR